MTRACLLQSPLLGLPRSPGRSPRQQHLLLNTGNANVMKQPTEEPNNTKELQIKAYTKQLNKTAKETEVQRWMKVSRRKKRNCLYVSRQQTNISRIWDEFCRRRSPGRVFGRRDQDWKAVEYSKNILRGNGAQTGWLGIFWDLIGFITIYCN